MFAFVLIGYSPQRSYINSIYSVTATPENYTLSLHDALPISCASTKRFIRSASPCFEISVTSWRAPRRSPIRSEEHTSELQSRLHLVCRLLLEKKNTSPISVSSNSSFTIAFLYCGAHPRTSAT